LVLRAATIAFILSLVSLAPARADMSVCNSTASRVGVALGYRDPQGWITEGWWNLKPNQCEKLLSGRLAARFYYVYGVDYDRGGEWAGSSFMCTGDKEFTIRGVENCLSRGFDRTGFFEVDTGEQKDWRVQLTDSKSPQQTPATK
jgi:uncharacterized membrane protein